MIDLKAAFSQKNRIRILVVLLIMTIEYGYLTSASVVTINFHKLYTEEKHNETWRKNRWLGWHTQQNPLDAWMFQEIVYKVQPDIIIETGTYLGGGALYLASLLELIRPNAKIFTIDIKDWQHPLLKEHPLYKKYVNFILGSSHDLNVVGSIKEQIAGKKTLVILDARNRSPGWLKRVYFLSFF